MPACKLRAIIFDIGRVLVRVDISRAMGRLAHGISLSPDEVWSAIQKDPRWMDWQDGRISPHDWCLHLNKRLGANLSFSQFSDTWNQALDPNPIQDNTFLETLSKTYRLALLSNTDPIHVAHMEKTYEFFRFFPTRIYSCTVGASKPNPLIYRQALLATKVKAEEALYIDDVAAYVDAAKSLGMAGITFVSVEQLRQDLTQLGVALG